MNRRTIAQSLMMARRGAAAVAALGIAIPASFVAGATPLPAEPDDGVETAAIAVDSITGRDVSVVDLPGAPQKVAIRLGALRGFSWRDGRSNRLLLERDVRVSVGGYEFNADRAVVWVSDRPAKDGSPSLQQWALYLDNARDPSAPPLSAAQIAPAGGGVRTGVIQSARRLLVTVVVVVGDPPPQVHTGAPLNDGRPADNEFIAEAEARLSRYLRSLVEPPDTSGPAPAGQRGPLRVEPTESDIAGSERSVRPIGSEEPEQPEPEQAMAPTGTPPTGPGGRDLAIDTRANSGTPERRPPALPKAGSVIISSPDNQRVETVNPDGTKSQGIAMTGGVWVQYETAGRQQCVQLSAQRAVVFLAASTEATPESRGGLRMQAKGISGIYLEGDVEISARTISGRTRRPDQYTLRGSRVYYDVQRNSAVVLDAVFWTYDQERGMPLYLRAETIRQESLKQFTANKVTMANVAFAEPTFAIGASTVTITRGTDPAGAPLNTYDARDVVFTAGGVPLAYSPKVAGEFKPSPLRRLAFGSDAGTALVRTAWDMNTILGIDAPKGNTWDLLLDGYFTRGPGVGTDLRFVRPDTNANALLYYVHDTGEDHFSSGADREPPQENRGLVDADYVHRFDEHWTMFGELSYISDEAFIDSFFRREGQERREFSTGAYLRRLEDNTGFSLETRGTMNDFISNQYLLESRGYYTQKLPEARVFMLGESLFDGLLVYSGSASYSRMNLVFNDEILANQGYNTFQRSNTGFGLAPTANLANVLTARGLDENTVNRFDSRHEVEMPLHAGPFNIVPFAAVRATIYDGDFAAYNDNTGDDRRIWSSIGSRFSTSIVRADQDVRSQFFDLTGLRHIITPNATIWASGTNVDESKLPIYDQNVEALASGTVARVGVNNVFQTHRPGTAPGTRSQLRSVDWLKVNTDYIWSSSDTNITSPFGSFIEADPELSNLGQYVHNTVVLQVTDAVSITNDMIYSTDDNSLQRMSVGSIIDHGEGFSSFVEYRALEALSERFFDFGGKYELNRKYSILTDAVYDLDQAKFQSVSGRVARRFPQWTVELGFRVDTIEDRVSVGVVFTPTGAGRDARTRIWTREFDDLTSQPAFTQSNLPDDRISYGPFAQ